METNIKKNIIPLSVFGVLLLACLSLKFSLYGDDGLSVWMPALADFCRGQYQSSSIFGGQNLLGLYGKLPFWLPLKIMGFSPGVLINMSFWFFSLITYILSSIIFKGITGRDDHPAKAFILFYILFSPVFTNRLYAGHFNLEYGMIPLLVAIALIYNQSRLMLVFSIFCLWCTFTIQSYQILAYHFFYVPVFIVWFRQEATIPLKKYTLIILGIFSVSFLLSIDVFLQFVQHAQSADNMRNTDSNLVYSYLTSHWTHLGALFTSGTNILTEEIFTSHFHELNYPIGFSFMAAIGVLNKNRKILIALLATFLFLVLLSFDLPVINLFAKLPLIKLFRVPQRSLMLAAFLIPLVAVAIYQELLSWKTLAFLLVFILLSHFVIFEVYLLLGIIFIPLYKKYPIIPSVTLAFSVSLLFNSFDFRVRKIISSNNAFEIYRSYVQQLDQTYKLSGSDRIVHFETPEKAGLLVAANYLNIKTIEGYGHPPKKIVDIIGPKQPDGVHAFNHMAYIRDDGLNFKQLVHELGITDIFYIQRDGTQKHVFAKDLN